MPVGERRTVLHMPGPDALLTAAPRPEPAAAASLPPRALCDRGATLMALGAWRGARQALQQAVALKPDLREAWQRLAALLRLSGEDEEAAAAEERSRAAPCDTTAQRAPSTSSAGKLAAAENKLRETIALHAASRPAAAILRDILFHTPTNVAALRLLAEHWGRQQPPEIIEAILLRALELAPDYAAARRDFAGVLLAQAKWPEALPHIEKLLATTPRDTALRLLHAETLTAIGDASAALAILDEMARRAMPRQAQFWLAYARALKDSGRVQESAQACRVLLQSAPANGAAWWALSDLKAVALTETETAALPTLLADPKTPAPDRALLHYAYGSVLERRGEYGASFAQYAHGASLRRAAIAGTALDYDPDALSEHVRQAQSVFTQPLLARHARAPTATPTPIFIVGMPRSGSTLIEQILASHSMVEGTSELPELSHIVRRLDVARRAAIASNYPACLRDMSTAELDALGAAYLARTEIYRKCGKPFFIDKLPGNWLHAGLILLILPNAKIIDARRDPMGCGFAMFKQLLTGGANYSYDLGHIGRRIVEYARFMQHLERELPGRVHRVDYETLVQDTEPTIRALLAHCGLNFEPACLEFWKTDRVVRTPSAAQVRRPIFRDALQHWRHYEPWLGNLREALRELAPDAAD